MYFVDDNLMYFEEVVQFNTAKTRKLHLYLVAAHVICNVPYHIKKYCNSGDVETIKRKFMFDLLILPFVF